MGRTNFAIAVTMMAALCFGDVAPSHANWLSRLVREAGEAGGAAGLKTGTKLGSGMVGLDQAAAHVASLPRIAKATPLAAHVTPEGHWKFVNREGEIFTAASADELARVRATLAPDAASDELAFYVSSETIFARRDFLKELPESATLNLVVGREAFPLRRAAGSGDGLVAIFRPGVTVEVFNPSLFEEAIYRLARPLNRANIRVLALAPGGPRHLPSVPRYDPVNRAALVDSIDPETLPAALSGIRGQTALLSGRIEGNTLTFRPARGPEQSLDIAKLVHAAEAADVNLILLQASAAHQPGGRNWFWQTIAVAGLDDAMKRATFADFLGALGGGGDLMIKAAPGSQGRVVLSAVPVPGPAAPLTDTLGHWIGEVTGNVAVKAADVYARDAAHEKELDARIVPGIPSVVQYAYLASFALGILSIPVSLAWWSRLWPPEQRREYAGRIGHATARVVRMIAYFALFLPLVGLPAFVWGALLYLWSLIAAPARAWSWLRNRQRERRAPS